MAVGQYIIPDWPVAAHVKSVITTRYGGASRGCYAGFNVADHVGDDADTVAANRKQLAQDLELPGEPLWLEQVHGTRVVDAGGAQPGEQADGSFTHTRNRVCAVMTADCLPLLLCDKSGSRVAALHAGWRGLAAGIIERGMEQLAVPGEELIVYLGPAIGPSVFEVGDEVREQFCRQDDVAAEAFRKAGPNKWLADIYLLARQRLHQRHVSQIYGGGRCTYTEAAEFFSYRRDGQCGRMVSMVWMDDKSPL